jgi:hypothetical protein
MVNTLILIVMSTGLGAAALLSLAVVIEGVRES